LASIIGVPGIDGVARSDLRALAAAAQALGANADDMALAIGFETDHTFNPAVRNARGSGATGLIQIMPDNAARLLGLVTPGQEGALAPAQWAAIKQEAQARVGAMSFAEQLERIVLPYFAPYRGRIGNLDDLYLAIFWPAAIGKGADYVIAREGTSAYAQNSGFDQGGKGWIQKSDIVASIRGLERVSAARPRVEYSSASPLRVALVLGLFGAAGTAYGYPRLWAKLASFAKGLVP
jgi:hypothetical protein